MKISNKNESGLENIPTPKVSFEVLSLEEEADMLFSFCYRKDGMFDWSEKVYKVHPKLKEVVSGVTDEIEFKAKLLKYVKNFQRDNADGLEKARERFQTLWDKVEEVFFAEISTDFKTNLPDRVDKIRAGISINPICPRFIDAWAFNLYYGFPDDRMIKTSVHEIIHFFWFKKWSEVFPDYDKKMFDSPHPEWKLSEMVVHSIMNENNLIQEMVNGSKSDVYTEFQSVRIDGKGLAEYFGDIYKLHVTGEISFDDFMRLSWKQYQQNKEIIDQVKR
jgi:hypothetical protein